MIDSQYNILIFSHLSNLFYNALRVNDINNNGTTKINLKTFNIDLIHQIAFNFPLKIKNTFKYSLNMNHSEISNQNINRSFSLKNDIAYSFNKIYVLNFSSEFYKPDFKQTSDLLFLNFNFNYSPKESSFKYSFSVKKPINVVLFSINAYIILSPF